MPRSRTFEYTDGAIIELFDPGGVLDLARILTLPALFMSETVGTGSQLARVGTITQARLVSNEVRIEYSFETEIPPIPNSMLQSLASELMIQPWEFSRTHWAIKDVDLFRVLLRHGSVKVPSPKVFRLDLEDVDERLISVMMPFDSRFDEVYTTLRGAAKAAGFRCLRADDIWKDAVVIQDVVSLIARSRVVVCDCSSRNANVFCEAGIAHTLGREVVLITQSEADIPFDLRHLRYLPYLNNGEGRAALAERVDQRLRAIAEEETSF